MAPMFAAKVKNAGDRSPKSPHETLIESDALDTVDIEMLLGDRVSQRYLYLFAQRFFCADTVQCMIALRDLQIHLKSQDNEVSNAVTKREYEALTSTYFADNATLPIQDVPAELRKKLAGAVLVDEPELDSANLELISQADKCVARFIAQDIVKRFRESHECRELLYVHPRRALEIPDVRKLFVDQLTQVEKQALDIWVEANELQRKQDDLFERAGGIFQKVDGRVLPDAIHLRKVQGSLQLLVQKLLEGSETSPLASAMDAALSTLNTKYLELLDGPRGAAVRTAAGIQEPLTELKAKPVEAPATPIDLDGTDYNEGW